MGTRTLSELAPLAGLDASTLRYYVGTRDDESKRQPKLIAELRGKTWVVEENVFWQWLELYQTLETRGRRKSSIEEAKTAMLTLSDDAKKLSRELVEAWNSKAITQQTHLVAIAGGDEYVGIFGFPKWIAVTDPNTHLAHLQELQQAKLIVTTPTEPNHWDVVLMQRLRDAVRTNFQMPDPSTPHVIANYVTGDQTIEAGASAQFAATGSGNVYQYLNHEQTVDKIIGEIDPRDLENPELATAIEDLRTEPHPSRFKRLADVLGRCLAHANNAAGIISALVAIKPFIQ